MNKGIKAIVAVAVLAGLSGCTSSAQRMNDDDSSDRYSQSAHRQNKYQTSCSDLKNFVEQGVELTPAQEQQSEKCPLSATAKSEHVVDKGYHPTGKAHTWKGYGVTVKQHADGQVFVDDSPALQMEDNEHAKVYQSGLFNVIIHDSGRVDLMNNGQFVGHLK